VGDVRQESGIGASLRTLQVWAQEKKSQSPSLQEHLKGSRGSRDVEEDRIAG
jgi:hypothetical protein